MASREHKRASLNEKLQQLRAATNSSAVITIYQLIYSTSTLTYITLIFSDYLIHCFFFSCLNLCGWQMNKASIIVDASKYIKELKQKVARLNQDIGTSTNPILPAVHIY